ncbi:hypothetical protein LMG19282_04250 [Cupriavidus campinensis]|uniref:head-tail connector protein n=1 Tax=Cupriavidus campinensis TaxID=151783 RepID=UPI001B17170A|nr:head-tail connector protein [Cupriavidus campinensis]CAG2152665.1 hypothetical protein LMG19282_04250 [Cupriavidus campinensis]
MAFVTIDLAIKHVRAEVGTEDDLIQLYLEGAQQAAMAYVNRQVFATQEDLDTAQTAGTAGDFPMVVNAAIKAAILKTTGDLYANREDSVVGATAVELPVSARRLLRPYRITPGV